MKTCEVSFKLVMLLEPDGKSMVPFVCFFPHFKYGFVHFACIIYELWIIYLEENMQNNLHCDDLIFLPKIKYLIK